MSASELSARSGLPRGAATVETEDVSSRRPCSSTARARKGPLMKPDPVGSEITRSGHVKMRTEGKRVGSRRWSWWVAWAFMAFLCVLVSLVSFPPYLPFVPDVHNIAMNPSFPHAHALIIASHAVPAGLAMLLGPFQFVAPLRRRFPAVHRNVGRVYLICVAFGGTLGVLAATISVAGFVPASGFFVLGVLWLYSGVQAYVSIRKRRIQLHRVWMIRNFALTFGAVMLRLILPVGLTVTSIPRADLYSVAAWAWAISLVFAEWFIVQRTLRPPAQTQRQHSATETT